METIILLISNGQSKWSGAKHFRPPTDTPLNDVGIQQAEATGRYIAAKWQPRAIYSSPLPRAVRTAEAIAENFNLPVVAHPGLAEIDYGEWQGVTVEKALKQWPEMVDAWFNTPHRVRIPGGETLENVRTRAMKTVNELGARHAGQTIILVSHTVTNRIILLGALGLKNERFWHIRQEPCAINVFEVENGEYTLVSLNDTCHLSKLAPV